MPRPFILAAALACGTAFGAAAQEVYVYDDYDNDDYVSDDAYLDGHFDDDDAVGPPMAYRLPVYGWVYARPADCGTFRYWNGERCADARFEPPRD